jgi:predicted TIM-barrel enzyme
MQICDGAIIGSDFKPYGDTQLPIDRQRVRSLVGALKGKTP